MDAAGPRGDGAVDVAVVGAGPMGLVTALMAARAGIRVAVYERAADFSASAGWHAAGILSPDCAAVNADPAIVDLGRRSIELWPELSPAVSISGTLVVAARRHPGALERFAAMTENYSLLDADRLAAFEPALAGGFSRALFYPFEGQLDPPTAFAELEAALGALGVSIRFGWSGTVDELRAERIVDVRGLGARERFRDLRGRKASLAVVRSQGLELRRPVLLINPRHELYVAPRAGGNFIVGTVLADGDPAAGVTVRVAGELMTHLLALHPAFGEAEILDFASGQIPLMPEQIPRIQVGERIIAVNGLSRYGWMVAPAIAEDLVRIIYSHATRILHPRPTGR